MEQETKSSRILVIEDDAGIRELVRTGLTLANFQVIEAGTGEEGLNLCRASPPDLVILDLMLPDIDGYEVCAKLRQQSATRSIPIICLTARVRTEDKVAGLEAGANDYLTKPFEMMELLARVRAQVRERKQRGDGSAGGEDTIVQGEMTLDRKSRVVRLGHRVIEDLTPREFAILEVLLKESPRVVSREELHRTIWGPGNQLRSRVVDVHILSIRRKLGPHGAAWVQTVSGGGYRFLNEKRA
ncbi:MAG: response regulator transcription factor [Elusimicrobia bacterium]|nr:response regulator transcription factor [Elusimicrobiota bacterium]